MVIAITDHRTKFETFATYFDSQIYDHVPNVVITVKSEDRHDVAGVAIYENIFKI
jgi:hypothetical protein